MDTQENRRTQLRRWIALNGTPTKEKSYFSQLASGSAPFGEKAAARIEGQYGMGSGYLDSSVEPIRRSGTGTHNSNIRDASIKAPNGGVIVESPPHHEPRIVDAPIDYAKDSAQIADGRASVSARPIVAWDREEELGDEYVLIPRLDVKFSAGNGKIIWHVDEKGQRQAFRKAWCARLGINPEHAATIVNDGQSMESRIQDGDSLVVDYKATRIIDGKVYALAYRGELYVKRLFKLPSGGLIVRSDNPDKARFPDINLAPEDMEFVEIVAQVKGVSGGV